MDDHTMAGDNASTFSNENGSGNRLPDCKETMAGGKRTGSSGHELSEHGELSAEALREVRTIAALTAESLDGAVFLLDELIDHPDLPPGLGAALLALADAVGVSRDRIDHATELLEL